MKLVAAAALFAAVAVAASASLGDQVRVSAYLSTMEPLTASDATANGWKAMGGCLPGLGIMYSKGGVSKSQPTLLFFTPGGQITGVGVAHFDAPPHPLISQGYWKPLQGARDENGDPVYYASLTFRGADAVCSGQVSNESLRDRAVLNADTVALSVPLTNAGTDNWYHGGCLAKMGYHYSMDTVGGAKLGWDATTLIPISPMYHPISGELQAILFSTPVTQRGKPFSAYEGPFPTTLFCKGNYCEDCAFEHHFWSTMHVFFKDTSSITCPNRCA